MQISPHRVKVTVVHPVHNLVRVHVVLLVLKRVRGFALTDAQVVQERVDIPVNVMSAQTFAKEVVMAHVMLLVKHHQLVVIQ